MEALEVSDARWAEHFDVDTSPGRICLDDGSATRSVRPGSQPNPIGGHTQLLEDTEKLVGIGCRRQARKKWVVRKSPCCHLDPVGGEHRNMVGHVDSRRCDEDLTGLPSVVPLSFNAVLDGHRSARDIAHLHDADRHQTDAEFDEYSAEQILGIGPEKHSDLGNVRINR